MVTQIWVDGQEITSSFTSFSFSSDDVLASKSSKLAEGGYVNMVYKEGNESALWTNLKRVYPWLAEEFESGDDWREAVIAAGEVVFASESLDRLEGQFGFEAAIVVDCGAREKREEREWCEGPVDYDHAVKRFQWAWAEADEQGLVGQRTLAGLKAVFGDSDEKED